MSFQRDLTWAQIEAEYSSSVSHQLARYAQRLSYADLPDVVVHQAKRCLLDAIGCAIGAYDSPGRPMCESVIEDMGGKPEATVIGSGMKTSSMNAALVNSFMVRYLDFSDVGGGGHNSDAIAALLAVAEAGGNSGQEFLTALVLSYEIGGNFIESLSPEGPFAGYRDLASRGWCTDIRAGLNVPPALGLLMGLEEEQIANAIGATLCHGLPLNLLDANDEEFVMSKNLRFGWVAYNAILACKLAQKGFTGPRRVVEGEYGFNHTVMLNKMTPSKLYEFDRWHILETSFKPLCTNFTTQAHIQATISLVKAHDLKPEDIEKVQILACRREVEHTTYGAKKYPRNGESADHSAFYGNALAIVERDFGPDSFKPEKFTDPVVLSLIERIEVVVDPDEPHLSLAGTSIITTKDGSVYKNKIDVPKGFVDDPLSDDELIAKFRGMAEKRMPSAQVDALLEKIWSCDELANVQELTELFAFAE